jgi:hypothetical protein
MEHEPSGSSHTPACGGLEHRVATTRAARQWFAAWQLIFVVAPQREVMLTLSPSKLCAESGTASAARGLLIGGYAGVVELGR